MGRFWRIETLTGNSFQNRGKVSELGKMIIKLPYLSDHYPMIMHSLEERFYGSLTFIAEQQGKC